MNALIPQPHLDPLSASLVLKGEKGSKILRIKIPPGLGEAMP